MRLTKAQQRALKMLWIRADRRESLLALRRKCVPEFCGDAVLVRWCGMTIGIEADGYTHS